MDSENYNFLANASVILGVIVILICLYIDDMPHRTTILWTIPAMTCITYISLFLLSYKH